MRSLLLFLLILGGLSLSSIAFADAQPYYPLVGVPGLDSASNLSAEDYVKALYMLAITVAGLLAVVKIIFGGVQYMLTDVVTSKSNAIKDIRGALLGLLIVLSAVLILNTINPNLTKLNILGNAPKLQPITSSAPSITPSTGCSLPTSCPAGQQLIKNTIECGQCVPTTVVADNPTAQAQSFQYNTIHPDPTTGIYRIDTATLEKLDSMKVLTNFEAGCAKAGLGSESVPYPHADPYNNSYTIYSCQ